MVTDVAIRPAGPDDVVAVLAIDRAHDDRAEEVADAVLGDRCLVAADGGDLVGFCVAGALFGFDFLELLVVRDDARRRGVGTALVEAWAARARSPKLFTSTNVSNAPMRALCERTGFVEAGRIEHLDEGDPEIVFFRPADRPTREPGS